MSAHDRWLANYHQNVETAYCTNATCGNHADGLTVLYEEEYGQGWTTPEECPLCYGDLTFDAPDPPDDDEDDSPAQNHLTPTADTPEGKDG